MSSLYPQVQTGFGRTGDQYWAFESYDVMPDIGMCSSACVLVQCAIAESFVVRNVPDSLHLQTNIIAVDVSVRRPSSVYKTLDCTPRNSPL